MTKDKTYERRQRINENLTAAGVGCMVVLLVSMYLGFKLGVL